MTLSNQRVCTYLSPFYISLSFIQTQLSLKLDSVAFLMKSSSLIENLLHQFPWVWYFATFLSFITCWQWALALTSKGCSFVYMFHILCLHLGNINLTYWVISLDWTLSQMLKHSLLKWPIVSLPSPWIISQINTHFFIHNNLSLFISIENHIPSLNFHRSTSFISVVQFVTI